MRKVRIPRWRMQRSEAAGHGREHSRCRHEPCLLSKPCTALYFRRCLRDSSHAQRRGLRRAGAPAQGLAIAAAALPLASRQDLPL